jgi:hypothetical protein
MIIEQKEMKMEKSLFGKILKNHSLAMILCCAIPLVLFLILSLSGSLGSWGYYALFLLCPLLHIFMMRGHGSHVDQPKGHPSPAHETEGPIPSPNLAKDLQTTKKEPNLND